MVLSIGRVQTPTLAMIVQRQKEMDAFVSETYWELKTIYKKVEFIAVIDRLKDIEKANKGLAYLEKFLFEITDIEVKENKEGNPKLFDLTGLQVEANKKYGYTAEETLKYVQSLYEKKLVTYPRVDTTYLSEDLYPKIAPTLRNLRPYVNLTAPLLDKPIPKSKNVFDNNKVTDHHAIIPTGEDPSAHLSIEEKRIYDRITRRFIAVFYPECKVSNTTVMGKVGEVNFKATGKQILEPGWRVVYANDKNEEKEEGEQEEKVMPAFIKGESGPHQPFIHQGKTTPPKAYTEATLLRAMETAGKQIDNEEMRELMKDNGIGRPSTRANIIETLFKRNYITRKKKNIVATPTGMDLIDCISIDLLKSPELTGVWERKLRLMEKGEYALDQFKSELFEMVTQVTNEVKNHSYRTIASYTSNQTHSNKKSIGSTTKKPSAKLLFAIEKYNCPKCKQNSLMKGKTAYGCKHFNTCGFKIPFVMYNKKLSDKNIAELIDKGSTSLVKGVESPISKEQVNGKFIRNSNYEIEFIVQ
jgi:DNA topoisomerase-3